MFDCHCHILPGLDDGARTLDDSVYLASCLVSFGFTGAACTSHRSYMYRNTPETVTAACDRLRDELAARGILLEIIPSMEYRLVPETWTEVIEKGWLLPWEGNHILIELPIRDPARLRDLSPLKEIRKLVNLGYRPVLAHPERYLYLSMMDYRALKAAGAEFQRNLGSLEGFYGDAVRVRASELEQESMYDRVGSDLHNREYAAYFAEHVFRKRP